VDELRGNRVLVVGMAGFLWRPVCEALREAGADICSPMLEDPADLTDFLTMAAWERPEIIVYMAEPQTMGMSGFLRRTLLGGMNALQAAVTVKARLVMVTDDNAVFQDSSDYDVARQALLVLARAYRKERSLVFSQVLPCPCYGPVEILNRHIPRLIPSIVSTIREAQDAKSKKVTLFGAPKNRMPLLHAKDAARAVAAACTLPGCDMPFQLMPKAVPTLGEIVAILVKEIGFEGKVEWDKKDIFAAAGRLDDDGLAREALGWEPKIGLQEGLAEAVKTQLGIPDAKEPQAVSAP